MITTQEPGSPEPVAQGPDLPGWLRDAFEVLELRRVLMMRTAVAILALGLLAAVVAPDVLPPKPAVGMAAGVAAVLIGAAVALALDAADTVIRGARHVRALGGRLLISGRAVDVASHAVAARIDQARARHPAAVLSVGVVPVSTPDDVAAFVAGAARSLAALSRRVLVVDLVEPTDEPGAAEVVTDRVQLHQAVQFDPDLMLASLGAGADVEVARRSLPKLLATLPADIEICLIVTPAVGDGDFVPLGVLDHVVAVVREDTSRRVDLVAVMDVLEEQAHDRLVALLPSAAGGPPDDGDPVDTAAPAPDPDGAERPDDGVEAEDATTRPEPSAEVDATGHAADADDADDADVGTADATAIPVGAEAAESDETTSVADAPLLHVPDGVPAALVTTAEIPAVTEPARPRAGRALGEPLRIPSDADVSLLDDRDDNLAAAAALHAFASELEERSDHGPQV